MIAQEVTKRLLAKKLNEAAANYQCSVIATLKLFATKWKPCILCYLAEKPRRYNELHRIIPNISRKILSDHLKELEADKLVVRAQHDIKLQRVDYSLSQRGRSLLPVMTQLEHWGLSNIKNVLSIKEMLTTTTPYSV